jgi:hypothetical protein
MATKTFTPKTITFRSHHETDVVMAGLQLLEVSTENELERERARGEFADEELLILAEKRLERIAIARMNLLGIKIKAVA